MIKEIKRFTSEILKWRKAGYPLRPSELVSKLFNEQCKPCEYFSGGNAGGRCDVCGCSIRRDIVYLNKLAMATTRCPLEEPRWVEYEEATEFYTPEEKQQNMNKRCCS